MKKQKFMDGPPSRAKTILFSLETVPAVAAQTSPGQPCFAGTTVGGSILLSPDSNAA
jgi:hypothetical protein